MATFKGIIHKITPTDIVFKLRDDLSVHYAHAILHHRYKDEPRQRAWVAGIVDGDTIDVKFNQNSNTTYRIRLIGVDTPEVNSATPAFWGPEAKDFTESQLPIGSVVYLQYGPDKKDDFDRTLAYVFLEDGRMLNEMLVEGGHAKVQTIAPNDQYAELFVRLEKRAHEKQIGLWQESLDPQVYPVLKLDDFTFALRDYTFVDSFTYDDENRFIYRSNGQLMQEGDRIVVEGDLNSNRAIRLTLDTSPDQQKAIATTSEARRSPIQGYVRGQISSTNEKVPADNISAPPYPEVYQMRLGYSLFAIPPLSINIQRRATVNKIPSIRSKGSIKAQTGHSDTRIMLDLYFSSIEDINDPENGLRALIAQFKRTPFLPVDNYYLNIVHDIWNVALVNMSISTVPGFPNCITAQLSLVEFNHMAYIPAIKSLRQALNYDMFKWYFQKDLIYEYDPETMMPNGKPGRLEPIDKHLRTGDFEFYIVPQDELDRARTLVSRRILDDIDATIESTQSQKGKIADDKAMISRLNEIQEIAKSTRHPIAVTRILNIKEKVRQLDRRDFRRSAHWIEPGDILVNSDGHIEVRNLVIKSELLAYTIGVTAGEKFSVVVDGAPDEILTKMQRANDNADDAVERLVSTLYNERRAAQQSISEFDLDMAPFFIEDRDYLTLTGVQVSYDNMVSSIQMELLEGPTHQYLGSQDTYIKLDFDCRSDNALASLRQLMDYTQMVARDYRTAVKSGFMRLDNDIVNLMGVEHALIEDINVYTVPGFPGRYKVEMIIVDFDVAQSKIERTGQIVGKLDGSGRFIRTGEEYKKVDEIPGLDGLGRVGTDQAPFEQYHVEKFMSQFELYPDLELPTYEQVNLAYNSIDTNGISGYSHFRPIEKPHDRAKYVDPDFYYYESYTMRDAGREELNAPEGAVAVITDAAGGKVSTRPVSSQEDAVEGRWRKENDNIVNYEQKRLEIERDLVRREFPDDIEAPTLNRSKDEMIIASVDATKTNIYRAIIDAVEDNNRREITRARKDSDSPVIIPAELALWLANKLSGFKQIVQGNDGYWIPNSKVDGNATMYGIFMVPDIGFPEVIYLSDNLNQPTRVELTHIVHDYRINIRVGVEMMRRAFLNATGSGDNNIEEQKSFANAILLQTRQEMKALEVEISMRQGELDRISAARADRTTPEFIIQQLRERGDAARFGAIVDNYTQQEIEEIQRLNADISEFNRQKSDLQRIITEAERVASRGITTFDVTNAVRKIIWVYALERFFNHNGVLGESREDIWKEYESISFYADKYARTDSNAPDRMLVPSIDEMLRFPDEGGEEYQNRFFTKHHARRINAVAQIIDTLQIPHAIDGPDGSSIEQAFAQMWVDNDFYDFTGRMVRAFPTFHMFIIEEGRIIRRWKLWDNFYGFSSIADLNIVRSRKIAADTMTVIMSNVYSGIANEEILNDYEEEEPAFNVLTWIAARPTEEQIKDHGKGKRMLFLRQGSRIHLRIGYGSDASRLPIVFNGTITEHSVGDTVQILAQGDGLELSNKLPFGQNATTGSFGFGAEPRNILGQLMTEQGMWADFWKRISGGTLGWAKSKYGVHHFGEFWYDVGGLRKNLGEIGQNIHPGVNSSSRNLAEDINGELIDDEIALNPFVWFGLAKDEANVTIDLYDKTIWDIAQLLAMAVPNYIAAVHPFGFRSTLFYGKPHFGLCYDYDIVTLDEFRELPNEEKAKFDIGRKDNAGLLIAERRKPYQQWHVIHGMTNLIANNIKASSMGVYNNVIGTYHADPANLAGFIKSSRPTQDMVVAHADRDILPQDQTTTVVNTHIKSNGNWFINQIPLISYVFGKVHNFHSTQASAIAVTQSALRDFMKDMYKGQLTLIGEPTIKPYDGFYLWDFYNEMYGIAEVEQVVHHINPEVGFITTIVPDAAVAVADPERHRLWTWNGSIGAGMATQYTMINLANNAAATTFLLGNIQAGLSAISTAVVNRTRDVLIRRAFSSVISGRGINFRLISAVVNVARWAKGGLTALMTGATAFLAGSTVATAGVALLGIAAVAMVASSVELLIRRYFDLSQCLVVAPLLYKAKPFTAAMRGSEGIIVGTVNKLTNQDWLASILDKSPALSALTSFSDDEAVPALAEVDMKGEVERYLIPYQKTLDELRAELEDKLVEHINRINRDQQVEGATE